MGNDGNTEDTTTKQSPPRKMLKIEKAVNRCITDLVTLNQLTINNDLVTLKKELTLSDDQVKYLKDYLLEKFVPVQPVKQALQRKEEDHEELVEELVEEKEVLIRKHEEEKEVLIRKHEDALKDRECYEKVLRIISLRSKLENFVDKNYPLRINNKTSETVYGKPDSSYCDALNEMLVSQDVRFTQDVFIVMIRNRLDNRNITPAVFMKFARWLYNQMSDKTCHKMAQFSPPLPKFDDDGAIKEMLKAVEIDEDDPAVTCIQIILQPLNLPPIVTGTTP